MNILITGCAGFIGFHLSNKIISNKKYKVIGIDNLNSYYDVKLKNDRLKILKKNKTFKFLKLDITKINSLKKIFKKYKFDIVINLAAQAGVRDSIYKPQNYFSYNIQGFYNILELSRQNNIKHLLYASSSSVYGVKKKFPVKEIDDTSKPNSFYAASKKCNEIMAYSYSSIHKLNCTGLRFFTVYGPYGRPDMALFKFVDSFFKNKKINLYNNGNHIRDFTYIDDIINPIYLLLNKKPNNIVPHEIYNLASSKPINLKVFLKEIEKNLKSKLRKNNLPLQRGDIHKSHASIEKIQKKTNYKITFNHKKGIKEFIDWYIDYYNLNKNV